MLKPCSYLLALCFFTVAFYFKIAFCQDFLFEGQFGNIARKLTTNTLNVVTPSLPTANEVLYSCTLRGKGRDTDTCTGTLVRPYYVLTTTECAEAVSHNGDINGALLICSDGSAASANTQVFHAVGVDKHVSNKRDGTSTQDTVLVKIDREAKEPFVSISSFDTFNSETMFAASKHRETKKRGESPVSDAGNGQSNNHHNSITNAVAAIIVYSEDDEDPEDVKHITEDTMAQLQPILECVIEKRKDCKALISKFKEEAPKVAPEPEIAETSEPELSPAIEKTAPESSTEAERPSAEELPEVPGPTETEVNSTLPEYCRRKVKGFSKEPLSDQYKTLNGTIRADNVERSKSILCTGIDVTVHRGYQQQTFLHSAAGAMAIQTAELLLKDFNVDIDAVDRYGYTPIFYAIRIDAIKTTRALLKYHPDLEANKNSDGATALIFAAIKMRCVIITMLLEAGAMIEARGTRQPFLNMTALMVAASGGRGDCVEALLDKSAELEAEDARGNTALWTAAKRSKFRAVKMLLDHGADPNHANKKGETPLHAAASVGNRISCLHLIDSGADKTIKSKTGKIPKQLICKDKTAKCDEETIRILTKILDVDK